MAKMIKNWLTDMVNNSLVKIGIEDAGSKIRVEVPPNSEFGDFSTNAAMVCAKIAKTAPAAPPAIPPLTPGKPTETITACNIINTAIIISANKNIFRQL